MPYRVRLEAVLQSDPESTKGNVEESVEAVEDCEAPRILSISKVKALSRSLES
jgi:hypothetical protein